jgi:hypothetical protein
MHRGFRPRITSLPSKHGCCYVYCSSSEFRARLVARHTRAQNVLPSAIGESVVGVLRSHEAAIQKGAIVTVDVVSSRVRLLPIRRDPDT